MNWPSLVASILGDITGLLISVLLFIVIMRLNELIDTGERIERSLQRLHERLHGKP